MIELEPLEKIVYERLTDHNPNLGKMYLGALSKRVNDSNNPDKLRQCAHSIREVIEKLFRTKKGGNVYLNNRDRAIGRLKEIWGNSLGNTDFKAIVFCDLEDEVETDLREYLSTYNLLFESEKHLDLPYKERIKEIILELSPRFVSNPEKVESLAAELSSFQRKLHKISHAETVRESITEIINLCTKLTDLLYQAFPSDELADVQDLGELIKEAENHE